MLVSKKWLNHFVKVDDISAKELAETLTNAGLEVERIFRPVTATGLVIGQVEECQQHPDSDHLHVTKVNIGSEVLPIVCGAPNVAKGQKVIVAKVGAVLPQITIKETSIRGQKSAGMICSLLELGMDKELLAPDSPSHEGIEVLGDDAQVGEDPVTYLGLDDEILDVAQTPNRSDFMAMQSVGREVAALLNREYIEQPIETELLEGLSSDFKVNSETANCSVFIAKVIGKVEVNPSPVWIQRALTGAGMNPINNLVDISNLVMLETGQPTHFYDKDFFKVNEITVIDDYEGEVEALNGLTYKLQKGDTVISSGGEPIGIAGIKGLGNSMIKETTKSIVIEIASFDPVAIRSTSRRLTLDSDSSARYIKPMDNEAPRKALERILYLLKEYASIDEIHETIIHGDISVTPNPLVSVSYEHVNRLLGTDLSKETIFDVFKRLNFQPVEENGLVTCLIPSYRKDIFIAEDLIEEVIRVVGYDAIVSHLPQMPLTLGSLDENQHLIRKVEQTLLGLGAQQVVTYTLVSKEMTNHGQALGSPIELLSPLSDKRQYIRNNVSTSLMNLLGNNLDHKNDDLLYYEISQVYSTDQDEWRLGMVGSGNLVTSTYNKETQKLDYYRLKGIIEALLNELGINIGRISYGVNDIEVNQYHPYRSSKIYLDKKVLGILGELHPSHEITDGVGCELNLSLIMKAKKARTKYSPINKYPRVSRDIAVMVDSKVTNESLKQVISKAGKPYLVSVEVFDVYQKATSDDKKSMAYNLVFESNDRTLLDEDITASIERILDALKKETGATLR